MLLTLPAGFMKGSGVCPSVHLSVRQPAHRSTAAAACGGFAAERPADRRYRSIAGSGAQQQRRRSTALSNKCGQCHADSRGMTLNADSSENKQSALFYI